MRIAFATFADLPNPPVKGGAVEALIDSFCLENETFKKAEIDIYSVYDADAEQKSKTYKNTSFFYYKNKPQGKITIKKIFQKLFHIAIPDKNMKNVVRLINKKEYDFVIITSINRELKYVFKAIKSKTIWYLHADALSVLPIKDLEGITKECDAIIGVSEFVSKRIATVKNAKNVKTVLNCSDIVPISQADEKAVRQKFREKIGVSEADTLFTFVGRITKIKGILELINAFCESDLENTKLLIVGSPSGKEQQEYYKKLKETANENVIFYGYIEHDRLNEVYCASDIVVAPSTCHESALLVGLEALICKRRLITTNMGGIPEYSNGENVVLIDVDDEFEISLKKAIESFYNSKSKFIEFENEKYLPRKFYNELLEKIKEIMVK